MPGPHEVEKGWPCVDLPCASSAMPPALGSVSPGSPDDITFEQPVLVALGGRLPLDHDGLVGPAAGDDVLGRCGGGLLREGDPGWKNTKSEQMFHPCFLEQTQGGALPWLFLEGSAQLLCAFR